MNHETWDEGCRRGIFGLVLAILGFTTLAFGGEMSWAWLLVQGLTIGVLVLWIIRLWVSPKPQFLCPPLVWPILAFAVYAIGRYLTCEVEYVGRLELLQVLVYTFLFLAILNNLYPQDMVVTVAFTLIFLAMAASSYAMVEYMTHSTHILWVESYEAGRASATFFSADHFCGFVEMILPLALALLLVGRLEPLTRILLGYCVVAMLAGITVTYSRAGWVASVVGVLTVLLILLAYRPHRKSAAVTLLLLGGGAAAVVFGWLSHTAAFHARMIKPEGGLNLDVYVRVKVWVAATRIWLDHFWWGAGPAHFNELFNEYRPPVVQLRALYVHSDYLNVLADWGLTGGLLVLTGLVLLVAGVVRTWPRVRRAENDFGSGLSNRFASFLGLLGGLAAMLVHSLVDFNMHVPADALVALTLLALLSSQLRFATERYWLKLRLPGKLAITVMFAAGIGYLGWQTGRLGQQEWWLVRAQKLANFTPEQTKSREQAFACEPMNFANAFQIGEEYRYPHAITETDLLPSVAKALEWYQRSQKLNPHYSLSYVRAGDCLDILGLPDDAEVAFTDADRHDPNGYYTAACTGWHYMRRGEYAAARPWLMRSLQLQPVKNPVAETYLTALEQNLSDRAGNLP